MFHPLPLYIGLRYTRAKRRNHFISFISVMSSAGIALGIVVLITVLSVMNGFHKEVRERILGMASHADIRALDGSLSDWRQAVEQARRHPRVTGAAPYVEGQAMLIHGQDVSGVMVRGVLPELEPEVVDVTEHMRAGSLNDLQPGSYRIVLGVELAQVLDARVGDKITLVVPQTTITPAGSLPRMKRFTVAGLFEVGMGDFDRGVALVHMDDAAKLQRLGSDVTGVRLKLDDLFKAREVSHELARQYPELYRVLNWTDYHKNFFAALRMEKRMLGLLLFCIVIIAAFNIVVTLVMTVVDKQSDIAILKTLGATPRQIQQIFMVQGTVIGLVGTLVGVVLGVLAGLNVEGLVAWVERQFGIEFISSDVYYISRLPSDLHWDDVALVGIGGFVWAVLMTLYPSWRAFRTQPAEALRYE